MILNLRQIAVIPTEKAMEVKPGGEARRRWPVAADNFSAASATKPFPNITCYIPLDFVGAAEKVSISHGLHRPGQCPDEVTLVSPLKD